MTTFRFSVNGIGQWRCVAGRGMARLGGAGLGQARQGKASGSSDGLRIGSTPVAAMMPGVAWQGMARPGAAGQGAFKPLGFSTHGRATWRSV